MVADEKPKKLPLRGKLFCSAIYHEGFNVDLAVEALERVWGPIEFISERFHFNHTRYYEREMGSPLYRKFMVFKIPVEQDALVQLKLQARQLEMRFLSPQHGRCINIDPGILLPDKLLLATTKGAAHRPYLSNGIYADLTLIYQSGSYRPLDWTYPDYASSAVISMANALRVRYRLECRGQRLHT